MTTTSCLTVKIEQCLSKMLDPINVFISPLKEPQHLSLSPRGRKSGSMRGCRKLPGGTAVHLGKSECRCGLKHSPQEEGMRQRLEEGRDEATPGQTDRLAIPRGGGQGQV